LYFVRTAMAFVQAMNQPGFKKGVNGADVYDHTGDARVTLFTMLTRGLEMEYIHQKVAEIYAEEDKRKDLWVMAFQTRDIRGGKGERVLFYEMMVALYEADPKMTVAMLPLIAEYGCWRDVFEIWQGIPALEPAIIELVRSAYLANVAHYEKNEVSKMNLLPKWLPREKSKTFVGLAKKIVKAIYEDKESERKRLVMYRTTCSKMNLALKTVEVNMCGKTWSKIQPETVPGRCMKLHDDAFLNVKKNEKLRYPNDEDRMACRAHFQAFAKELENGTKKVHGANVIYPHELVVKLESQCGKDQEAIIQGQWNSIREETLKGGGLGKAVALCDFSGSMSGIPIGVSKALGILISECTHPAFRDHILTFDAVPLWHSFVGKKTLKEKLKSLQGAGQGLNTDFYRACRMILNRMIQHKVPVGEEPEDLIVITDMGFDDASTPHSGHGYIRARSPSWQPLLERIRREFVEEGETLYGAGKSWKPPRIVVWNVSTAFKDFHATADQEGVVQLSGWSPSILKALQTGRVSVQTPYEGMRALLDDVRYDPVRTVWENQMAK
jgi:Domain of unknown function (DUF2828)